MLQKSCYRALSTEGSNARASSLLRTNPLFQPASLWTRHRPCFSSGPCRMSRSGVGCTPQQGSTPAWRLLWLLRAKEVGLRRHSPGSLLPARTGAIKKKNQKYIIHLRLGGRVKTHPSLPEKKKKKKASQSLMCYSLSKEKTLSTKSETIKCDVNLHYLENIITVIPTPLLSAGDSDHLSLCTSEPHGPPGTWSRSTFG